MRIAKDGYPFDVDEAGDTGPTEVEIIQFLRPSGKRRRMVAEVGADLAEAAKDLILSAEELSPGTGKVAVYVRTKEEHPDKEHVSLADNGPGPDNPTAVLQRMIRKYANSKRSRA